MGGGGGGGAGAACRWSDAAVWAGRRRQHHGLAARDLGGHRQHEGAAGQHCGATGHVDAHCRAQAQAQAHPSQQSAPQPGCGGSTDRATMPPAWHPADPSLPPRPPWLRVWKHGRICLAPHPPTPCGGAPPPALMARVTRRHRTPGMVSTLVSPPRCASWKARMLLYAVSKAAVTSGSSCGSGSSCTAQATRARSRLGRRAARPHNPAAASTHGGGGGAGRGLRA